MGSSLNKPAKVPEDPSNYSCRVEDLATGPYTVVLCGHLEESVFFLDPKKNDGVYTVGRSRENDIAVRADNSISGKHGKFTFVNEQWNFTCIASKRETTLVVGENITKGSEGEIVPIPKLCGLKLGCTYLPILSVSHKLRTGSRHIMLECIKGVHKGQNFYTSASKKKVGHPYKIGRSSRSELTIDVPSVSGQHCEILHDNGDKQGHWMILDCESSHGTFVQGNNVNSKIPVYLFPGAVIRVGRSAPEDEEQCFRVHYLKAGF